MNKLRTEVTLMKKITVLILAKPGELRDGIEALLSAILQVDSVYCINNVNWNGAKLKKLNPDLIVFDSTRNEQSPDRQLRQIKEQLPSIKVINIVNSEEAKKKADQVYVDITLVKGFRGDRFIEEVDKLIKSKKST
jgi:AmiR/NasT family two-component response regulator